MTKIYIAGYQESIDGDFYLLAAFSTEKKYESFYKKCKKLKPTLEDNTGCMHFLEVELDKPDMEEIKDIFTRYP